MEHHFHAAVLLGFEGLIEIGAVSEIGAAVGDENGRVHLLLLDELRQGLEITLHVRLAAAQPQALLHDRAHVFSNGRSVDARRGDHAARPHRPDRLVEHISALGRQHFFLHGADKSALSMTWAGFHADTVDHAVRAFAFTDLLDPPEDSSLAKSTMPVAPCQRNAFMELPLGITMRWTWARRAKKFRPAASSNRSEGCREVRCDIP